MKDRTWTDPPTLNPNRANSPLNAAAPHSYESLLRFQPGYMKPSENEVIGSLAESWEWSPDGLQIVLKLRPGVNWHNKAPVDGRPFDIEDVLFSWNMFESESNARGSVANSVSPDAPVLGVRSTDSTTVVIDLQEPLSFAPGIFALHTTGNILMVPREADGSFDLRADIIGTGPFVLSEYRPSIGFTFTRNRDYWDEDHALVDEIQLPIITESAATLAQMKAGNIYTFGSYGSAPKLPSEDTLPLKRDVPDILLYQSVLQNPQGLGNRVLAFGWLPDGDTPFIDERVRQAVSMAIDRDLYQDVFFNIPAFEQEGLPVDRRWNTALLAETEGFWLDPKDSAFGPTGRFYTYDVAEAKKLLAAAGYPDGLQGVTSAYTTSGGLPTEDHAQVIDGMIAEIGINVTVRGLDYATEYIPQVRDARGQYEGWAYKSTAGGTGTFDAVSQLSNFYWSKGGTTFYGFSTTGRNDESGDPEVDALIEKARRAFDTDERRALVFDVQRYLARAMYAIFPPGPATGFDPAWPCVGNFRLLEGGKLNEKLWIDETKPPF